MTTANECSLRMVIFCAPMTAAGEANIAPLAMAAVAVVAVVAMMKAEMCRT